MTNDWGIRCSHRIPIIIERAKRCHRDLGLDRNIRIIQDLHSNPLVILFLNKMPLDSALLKCLSSGTIRGFIHPIDLKDVVDCANGEDSRLLSMAWACQIAAHEYYQHRSVPSSKSAKSCRVLVVCLTLLWLQRALSA